MIEYKTENGDKYSRVTYTHKGMYGLCPIYLEMDDSNGEAIRERSALFYPLMWLTDFLFFNLYQPIYEAQNGEPAPFCFKITRELKKPFVDKWYKNYE